MKKLLCLLAVVVGVILAGTTGCSNKKIDAEKVRAAFQTAPDDIKAQLEKGLEAIKSTNYSAAVRPLEKVGYGTKLTKEQRDILVDTIKKVRARIEQ
jgi:triosephosphate isomerase